MRIGRGIWMTAFVKGRLVSEIMGEPRTTRSVESQAQGIIRYRR